MVHGDDNGLILPPKIAPKQVGIILASDDDETKKVAKEIYNKLKDANITSFIDDSEKSFGFKMAEAEVNGIPVRIELGKRDISEDKITISRRDTLEKNRININDDIVLYITNLMINIQDNLFNRAKKRQEELTYYVESLDEVKKIMDNKPGFIYTPWCGCLECEDKMKEIKGLKSRCIVKDDEEHICPVCGKKSKHIVVWGIQY